MTAITTAAGLVTLVLVAGAFIAAIGIRPRLGPLTAVLRAAVQLGLLAIILQGAITDVRLVAAWLAVMLTVAIWTAGHRIGIHGARLWRSVLAAVLCGPAVATSIVFATGTLPLTPQYLLAVGGILTGNAMTIASLTGRGFLERVDEGWTEVEAWLALGASPPIATRRFSRQAAAAALLPSMDQAKTTGLVTLPGAFVGAIFGGASPIEAGRFQLIVLAGILCAGAVTAFVLLRTLAPQISQRLRR